MLDHQSTGFAPRNADLIVVGGGLAGLIAATKVAQAGHSVLVLEQSRHWGGRAATKVKAGLHLNQGAHALYCGGHAFRTLTELQVPFTGRFPNGGRALLLRGKTEYAYPATVWSWLTTGLLTLREKWIFSRLFRELPALEPRSLDKISLQTWVEQQAGRDNLAAFLRTMFRLNTFAADAERLSAGAAIEQLQMGLAKNVWYLDGGWQSLVEGLQGRAKTFGAEFRNSSGVQKVQSDGDGVSVTLANGEILRSRAAVLAVAPDMACKLLELPEDAAVPTWARQAIPVRVACLDVCLDRLPRPEHRFALGLDRPVYYSVHSAAAKLAPEGIAVIHLMKYLRGGDQQSPATIEAEREGMLDELQPGWRAHIVDQRFLPAMTVSHGLPTAATGGLSSRPAVRVDGRPGVFLAGDWVGTRGMLADASAASAEEAANCVLDSFRPQREAPAVIGSAMYVGT